MRKVICLFALLFLLGCKDEYKECIKTPPNLYTAGYDSVSIDTILIFGYEKGGNFSKRLNETYLVFPASLSRSISVDSFAMNPLKFSYYLRQYDNFDWQYIIPATGDEFNITEAKRKINKTSIDHPNSACTSPITSLKVNGAFVEFREDFQSLWLTKP